MPRPEIMQLATYLRDAAAGRMSADQWRWFWTRWGGGHADDPDSFNAEGGQDGDLGYYPVRLADETTIYLPCMERWLQLMLEAISESPNLMARMKGRPLVNLLSDNRPVPGAMLVLPIIDRAPNITLASSFTKLIPWGETDKYRLLAVRRADGLQILLTYDD